MPDGKTKAMMADRRILQMPRENGAGSAAEEPLCSVKCARAAGTPHFLFIISYFLFEFEHRSFPACRFTSKFYTIPPRRLRA